MRRENLERESVGGKGAKGFAEGEVSGVTSKKRKGYFHHLDNSTTSFFFTHFPDNLGHLDLWKLFDRFGRVGEVFLPSKRDKWGRRFGFVKFKEVSNEEELSRGWRKSGGEIGNRR